MKKTILNNYFLYLLLILGYLVIYYFDVEKIIYKECDEKPKSKIDFVYQQF
jgi:hypothetical protein